MPPQSGARESAGAPPNPAPIDVGPPPSFGRQVAQLVVIPALIVVVVLGVMLLFAVMAGQQDSIDDQINRLRQSSGQGRMAFGIQDPRYKDRSLAAHNLAVMLPEVKDPAKRAEIATQLVDILEHNIGPDEAELQAFVILALGQLGQPGDLERVLSHHQSPHAPVRRAVAEAAAMFPEDQADAAAPALITLVNDADPQVATVAAISLGSIADADDQRAVEALRAAASTGATVDRRDVVWNASIALARLGDEQASNFVAGVLLDRESLANLPAASPDGAASSRTLTPAVQDKVILSTLAAAGSMTHPVVWSRIAQLAENDPSLSIRKAAQQLLSSREAGN